MKINLQAFSIESATMADIDSAEHQNAKDTETLDHEYDVYLSDMEGETFIVEPDGTLLWPYRNPGVTVLELLAPILEHVTVREIKDYLIHREQREAEEEL